MILRTFEGEAVTGKMTTDPLVSQDGLPILLVHGDPFSPEEAEFFLEFATEQELEMLEEGGYDLPAWEGKGEKVEQSEDEEEIEPDED